MKAHRNIVKRKACRKIPKVIPYKCEMQSISAVSTIVFISDLHFDFVNGKFCEKESE